RTGARDERLLRCGPDCGPRNPNRNDFGLRLPQLPHRHMLTPTRHVDVLVTTSQDDGSHRKFGTKRWWPSTSFRPHRPRRLHPSRSENARKNALSSAARIGAAIHAVPAVQGPGHLRLLRLEPAGLRPGNRPVPGRPRIETRRRPPEPTGDVEGRSETRDQVEPLHDRSSNRVVAKGRPCNCRGGRGPLPNSHHPGGRVPHPPLQRILPETLSRANSRPLSVHEGTVLASRLTTGGPTTIRSSGLRGLRIRRTRANRPRP